MQVHGNAVRFGIHTGQQHGSYEDFVELWTRAEELGYDWVSDFDHFLPIVGDWTGPCFEGTTLLAALAAQTSRVRCGMLVLGVTYRHPAVVANIAATLDHISGGRLEFGIGAAWYELEHGQYGIPYPRIGERMDMLDEACRIMRSLWTQETTTFEGKHYQLKEARLEPKPVQEHLPLVIGGTGERRTLRIVAEHADIRKSIISRMILGEDEAEADDRRREALEGLPEQQRAGLFVGTPEQAVESLRPYVELGVGDILLGQRAPFDWRTIELVAQQVAPALRVEVAV